MNEYVPNWRKRFRSSIVTWYEHKCNIEYNNAHACPLDSTNLSLLLHEGFLLLNCMNSPNKTCAIGAHPMGAPGCPEFAFSTISALNTLIVSIHFTLLLLSRDSCLAFLAGDSCDILGNATAWGNLGNLQLISSKICSSGRTRPLSNPSLLRLNSSS